jgi:hypothetical protein
MTKKEVAVLSFKVLSIYAFVKALDRSYDILYYLFRKDQLGEAARTSLGLKSIPSLLWAASGIVLWFIAPLLATSIFKTTTPEEEPAASSEAIREIAFSIVGLFVLAMSLPDFVSTVAIMVVFPPGPGSGNVMAYSTALLVAKLLLGFWLLLGSHGIAKFVRSTRRV